VVYGGLLGAFGLGVLVKRATQTSAIVGMAVGIGTVTIIWLAIPERVAWPWFALIGTATTFAVGAALGRRAA
jgi:Na+/proline symporter